MVVIYPTTRKALITIGVSVPALRNMKLTGTVSTKDLATGQQQSYSALQIYRHQHQHSIVRYTAHIR
jgi:hypothetical protein